MIAKSIRETEARQIFSASDLETGQKIDLIAGGVPCQGFSMIGKRAMEDPRNGLVKEFVRIIGELRPLYFLFENVKGLTVGKQKIFLEELTSDLKALDYNLVLPWKILNAKNYAIPQNRERFFLLGAIRGETLPCYPDPASFPSVNCEQALSDLPDIDAFEELLTADATKFEYAGHASGYASLMRCENKESWKLGYVRNWNPDVLTSSMRTIHTKISKRRFIKNPPGKIEKISRLYKLSKDGISNTLRAGTDSSRGAFTSPRPIHYEYPRCLSVREMARLHSFPDWFRFHETKWHGARQIGNAVPPLLAYAIGKEIVKASKSRPAKPKYAMSLGNTDLLRMNMSDASAYWKISVPIAKRNQKSGVRKRSQSEIEASEKAV